MGKIFNSAEKNDSAKPSTFIDRSNENWYVKKNANKIAFTNSIEEIIDGGAKFLDFTNKELSVRIEKNSKNEDVERHTFIIFTIDNVKVLVKSRNELK
jgi:hypothetical protein